MTIETESGVIVALDHGLHWGTFPGFEDYRGTLETVLEGEPDGILGSVPFLNRFRDVLDASAATTRVGTLDVIHDSTIPGADDGAEIHRQAFSLEEAARVGADAVKVCVVYGREDPDVLAHNIEFAARIAENGREYGLDVVLEQVLWGNRIEDDQNPDLIEHAARLGVELGADALKLYYPGQERLDAITANTPCPVFVAGGAQSGDTRQFLETTRDAMDAGASGVTYGRNVWQHDDPSAMVRALKAIVNDGASPSKALSHLDG
ncbi:2-amino-3,7-dideoxy-D-threo-hept-6-ulosonic acidsynthase, DhnA-aldolase family [Halapricum desulfuricans]|uniref:fructose-bisphosphate aldolase n=1 Tax=Halapricum desulfuricans TaxID=2841257 RepID=A0A897NK16_9EURY|nr:hypothetical protein [Halapricum desulfuricans]QSG12651.1 2-amino-3,7-dideoxy-D-threo-hept-6-ulosonic acidsynthase, DhnA-aldolase family [Halapricum desulfuricans]